jgi:hypothetical protein
MRSHRVRLRARRAAPRSARLRSSSRWRRRRRRFGALARQRQARSAGALKIGLRGCVFSQSSFEHGQVLALGGERVRTPPRADRRGGLQPRALAARLERAASQCALRPTPCRHRRRRGADTSPSTTNRARARRAPCEHWRRQALARLETRAVPDDGQVRTQMFGFDRKVRRFRRERFASCFADPAPQLRACGDHRRRGIGAAVLNARGFDLSGDGFVDTRRPCRQASARRFGRSARFVRERRQDINALLSIISADPGARGIEPCFEPGEIKPRLRTPGFGRRHGPARAPFGAARHVLHDADRLHGHEVAIEPVGVGSLRRARSPIQAPIADRAIDRRDARTIPRRARKPRALRQADCRWRRVRSRR